MTKQIVKGLENIGKVAGVQEVVDASRGQRLNVEAAAEAVVTILGSVLTEEKTDKSDLDALLNFKPSKFVKEGRKTATIVLEDLAKLEALVEKLCTAKETLKEIHEANKSRGILGGTGETRQLEAMIVAGEKAIQETDPEVLNLYRFRRDHTELRALVDTGHAVFNALKKGEKADEVTLKGLTSGYADFLHNLLREERIVEVDPAQLRRWASEHEPFTNHASSWLYKDCRVCEEARQCRSHWFWGVRGDEQSVQLARDLRDLNNINSRIRNRLNPRRPAPTKPATTAPES